MIGSKQFKSNNISSMEEDTNMQAPVEDTAEGEVESTETEAVVDTEVAGTDVSENDESDDNTDE